MTSHCIYLPALSRRVAISTYCRAIRMAKAAPETTFKTTLDTWYSGTGQEIIEQFRKGIHSRINRHEPSHNQGRKWADEWWWPVRRLAHAVNTPRLRVYLRDVPHEYRNRLARRVVA